MMLSFPSRFFFYIPVCMVVIHGRVIQEVPDPQEKVGIVRSKTLVTPTAKGRSSDTKTEVRRTTDWSHLDQGWDVDSIVPFNYNKLIPPKPPSGDPVVISINLHITQIIAVKEDEQTFSVHAHYYQEWKDPRLQFPHNFTGSSLGLDQSMEERIWTPDTYFYNAIDGKGISVLVAPYNFVLTNDSRIQMAVRTVLTLSCDMNLRLFPHDSQVCTLKLMSLFHKSQDLIFHWREFKLVTMDRIDFPKYSIVRTDSGTCDRDMKDGFYCVQAAVHLRRRWEYYFIRIYGPSFLLVVTTFVGFWLPVFAYPARVAIIVTPLLSLITQQTQINAEINVNYVVSLHVWMMACTFFVFMALIELGFAVVYIHRVEERKQQEKNEDDMKIKLRQRSPLDGHRISREGMKESRSSPSLAAHDYKDRRRLSYDFIVRPELGHWLKNFLHSVYGQIDWYKAPSDRNKVDYISRLLFPIMFLIFTIIYIIVVYQSIGQDYMDGDTKR